jgi:dimethylsulfoniopropionate demethylase
MADGLNMSRRIRRTPYTDRVETAGVKGFSVVNHMLLPKAYSRSVEEDYWHLREHVQVWDVSCQRQVQIEGKDAAKLVQLMTPRNLTNAAVGECLYVPLIDVRAGLINDPVLLKLNNDKYWLSIADSDVLLWAEGLALGKGLNVQLTEPDVSPLAIQGPKADKLMVSIFGESIRKIGFFKFGWVSFKGTRQLIARSGYSRQGGFEIYLEGAHLGGDLWDMVWEAGQQYNLAPGCPNLIERIEGGLLSYGNEMTRENNPLEIGLEKYCSLDGTVDYIGREALENIAKKGPDHKIYGVLFDTPSCPTCSKPWLIKRDDVELGQITSGIYSPRLGKNIGVGLIKKGFWTAGLEVSVILPDGQIRRGHLSNLPFA